MLASFMALSARRGVALLLAFTGSWYAFGGQASAGTLVTINTNLGNIQVDLFNEVTPITVTNFVNLVTGGNYTNTIFHRSVSDFVIQGGGFNTEFDAIPNNGQILLEHQIKNTRGTIAMARTNAPHTATSQWFINTVDNSAGLGAGGFSPDGYAVFGWVVSGMHVVDAIAALPKFNFGSPFNELPLQNYTQANYNAGVQVQDSHKVIVHSVSITQQHPSFQNPIWNMDVNNSGTLNSADVMSIVNSMLVHGHSFDAGASKIGDTYKYFDTNGDGKVNMVDLMLVVNAILRGDTAPAAPLAMPLAEPLAAPLAAVPEPASLSLAVVGSAALVAAALRRRSLRRRVHPA